MTISKRASVIPALRYRDAHAAIKFLCDVFGFEKQAVYEGEDGSVAHAQLILDGGMIMLGSDAHEGDYAKLVRAPASVNTVNTQGVYVIVDDCRAHYERAKKGGAIIVMELEDKAYGGAGYSCRDPWGYVWSFGSYDPFAPQVPGGDRK
jgi:uncharacterized glyoxalase superfamily protein PhnB